MLPHNMRKPTNLMLVSVLCLQLMIVLMVMMMHLEQAHAQHVRSFPFNYKAQVDQIIQTITRGSERGKVYELLAYIADTFGGRLVGSKAYDLAAQELVRNMKQDGFENIQLQPVFNVTHWERGDVEELQMLEPRFIRRMEVMALGTSPGGFIEKAEVVVLHNFEELEAINVRGKIVLFNFQWNGYGNSVIYRSRGPAEAAKKGALACLVRSVTPFSIYSAHTGVTNFDENGHKIMAATITVEDAEMIDRMVRRGQRVVLSLRLNCQNFPPITSYNIIGEIRGSTKPNEVIVVGGHFDSWDVGGTGAMDDLGGIMVFYEGIKTLLKLGMRPKRTIRLVGYSAEEFGGGKFGGMSYVEHYRDQLKDHLLGVESDGGPFKPLGFEFTGGPRGMNLINQIATGLLSSINSTKIVTGGGGADVNPLRQVAGIPTMSPYVDDQDRYFWFHHTRADTMTVLNSDDLDLLSASLTSMLYVSADMDERFPRD
ncbi:hypothetical protein FDP41_010615 [Naegleria fowleri]|uniref:Carboxypeptidase Q n=1 Tax=Naegleria fowleri TaxID=5763 RepID=A0A6A5CD65_NAEFO|nr:uncharacterized protein FDP41_010615 [Naegleria fowleri]KAF0983550.1 hypothetical protein FDP41_010615 [Naegleria fowleri]